MTYDLNDLQSDLGHLEHLIDATAQTILECDFGPVGNRVPHMDRLNAFIFIARDIVAEQHRGREFRGDWAHNGAMAGWKQMTLRQRLEALIDQAFDLLDQLDGDPDLESDDRKPDETDDNDNPVTLNRWVA